MKIRQGFVSNSSSTSFTCLLCNKEYSGWDWEIPADWTRCEHGHHFHKSCAARIGIYIPEENKDEVLEDECPVCLMKKFNQFVKVMKLSDAIKRLHED